jgi:hypothetical protein
MFFTMALAIVRRRGTWYSGSLRTASEREGDFAEVLIVRDRRLTGSTKCVAGRGSGASKLSRFAPRRAWRASNLARLATR